MDHREQEQHVGRSAVDVGDVDKPGGDGIDEAGVSEHIRRVGPVGHIDVYASLHRERSRLGEVGSHTPVEEGLHIGGVRDHERCEHGASAARPDTERERGSSYMAYRYLYCSTNLQKVDFTTSSMSLIQINDFFLQIEEVTGLMYGK